MNPIADRYLGDGVYASFDGCLIWLDLRGQDNTTRIGLEPETFRALAGFSADVDSARQEMLQENSHES